MTAVPPKVETGARYNTGQACKILGVSRNTLRKYVKNGSLRPKVDKSTFRNVFEARELTRFWFERI